jgi:hypothetical protein
MPSSYPGLNPCAQVSYPSHITAVKYDIDLDRAKVYYWPCDIGPKFSHEYLLYYEDNQWKAQNVDGMIHTELDHEDVSRFADEYVDNYCQLASNPCAECGKPIIYDVHYLCPTCRPS